MQTRELLKTIAGIADRHDASWEFIREGGNHSVYRLNGVTLAIPRHREVGERLARTIIKQATEAARRTP